MGKSYLGVDVGSSKTHALITDGAGKALGFGEGGAGNHEVVGYPGLIRAVKDTVGQALRAAGITVADLGGAGFGVSGYDWPSEKEPTLKAISVLGIERRSKWSTIQFLACWPGRRKAGGLRWYPERGATVGVGTG